MEHQRLFSSVVGSWQEASRALGIRVIAPFASPQNEKITCVAFLPDFGSPNGMVIGASFPPNFETDSAIKAFAARTGMFCSFLNVNSYSAYEEKEFKDTLLDWGFFGPPEFRPNWLV